MALVDIFNIDGLADPTGVVKHGSICVNPGTIPSRILKNDDAVFNTPIIDDIQEKYDPRFKYLLRNPFAVYRMNEGSGKVLDSQGNDTEGGTLTAGAAWNNSIVSPSERFPSTWSAKFADSGSDYILMRNDFMSLFNGAEYLSILGWIYPTLISPSGLRNRFLWLIDGNNATSIQLSTDASSKITCGTRSISTDSTFNGPTMSKAIVVDTWHSFIIILDYRNQRLRIGIDGELEDWTTATTWTKRKLTYTTHSGGTVRFGGTGAADRFFDGHIDNYQFYKRVITAAEFGRWNDRS